MPMEVNTEDIEMQVWGKVESLKRWEQLIPGWMIYWRDEPMASPFSKNWQVKRNSDALKHMLLVNVANTLMPVVVAWDRRQKKVAGFSLSTVEFSTELQQKHPEISKNAIYNVVDSFDFDEDTKCKLRHYWEFMRKTAKRADVFNRYKVDKMWLNLQGNVLPEYRTCGIFRQLAIKFRELAIERGFRFMLGRMTSKYTADSALHDSAAEKVLEVAYKDNYILYDEMPEEVKRVHQQLTIVVVKLTDAGQVQRARL